MNNPLKNRKAQSLSTKLFLSPQLLFQKIIEDGFYVLFFVTPFILTTSNYELFEFPKMLFVYAMTGIITASWVSFILISGHLRLRRSFLIWPLLFFVVSQVFSTLFSIDPYTSIWGYYSRFHGGLASTLSYALLFLIFTSTATKKIVKNSLIALLAAASFISLYALAQHLGIDANFWVQDVQSRVFSTLGQPNWLAAWLVALLPLTWWLLIKPSPSIWPTTLCLSQLTTALAYGITRVLTGEILPLTTGPLILFLSLVGAGLYLSIWLAPRWRHFLPWLSLLASLALTTLLTLAVLFTKSRSGILALIVAYGFFWLLIFSTVKKPKPLIKTFILITIYYLLITFLVGTEWTPSIKQIFNFQFSIFKQDRSQSVASESPLPKYHISKSTDIRRAVWEGALNVYYHYPIFGSGVETFAYSFYNYRPRSHNDTSEWDFLYNKAHNEYLNFLATTGIVGTTAVFTLIMGYFLFTLFHLIKKRPGLVLILALPFLLLLSPRILAKLIIYPPLLLPLAITGGLGLVLSLVMRRRGSFALPQLTRLQAALAAGWLSIIVTNFYGFSVVAVALLFFLYPAFSTILFTKGKRFYQWRFTETLSFWNQLKIWQWLILFLNLLAIGYWLLATFNYYRADKTFNLGRRLNESGDVLGSLEQLRTALALRPHEALYHMEEAEAASLVAYLYHAQNASQSAQIVEQLQTLATQETETSLSLNRVHLNFYKSAAKIYITLAQINPQFFPAALKTLETAQQLSPTDPKLTLNLALLYQQLGKPDLADRYYQQTVELKPDYRQAWMAWAQFQSNQKKVEAAKKSYQYILTNIDPADAGAKEALEKIDK